MIHVVLRFPCLVGVLVIILKHCIPPLHPLVAPFPPFCFGDRYWCHDHLCIGFVGRQKLLSVHYCWLNTVLDASMIASQLLWLANCYSFFGSLDTCYLYFSFRCSVFFVLSWIEAAVTSFWVPLSNICIAVFSAWWFICFVFPSGNGLVGQLTFRGGGFDSRILHLLCLCSPLAGFRVVRQTTSRSKALWGAKCDFTTSTIVEFFNNSVP